MKINSFFYTLIQIIDNLFEKGYNRKSEWSGNILQTEIFYRYGGNTRLQMIV